MNKMAQGAIATGLGVALLLGGGGTLAVWNAEQTPSVGHIAAGNLNLVAQPGVWTNKSGQIIAPGSGPEAYKVVPGDVLTFTQQLDVTLEGNLMRAMLKATGVTGATGVSVSPIQLLDTSGQPVPEVLDGNQTVVAKITLTFDSNTARNQTFDFGNVAYTLEQIAPVG